MDAPGHKITEADDAYSRLHQAILRGELLPNQRLIELELAHSFGVGRAAVRTALARLEQEGLVEHAPNRGARVRAISEAEAIEILEARAVLEGLVARHAAQRATGPDLAALRAIDAAMAERLAAGDLLGVSELNSEFHVLLQRVAGHATAKRLLDRLQPHHVRYQYRTILVGGHAAQSLAEHRALLAALAAHDGAAAEEAMRAHLARVVDALRQVIDPAARRLI